MVILLPLNGESHSECGDPETHYEGFANQDKWPSFHEALLAGTSIAYVFKRQIMPMKHG